MIGQTLVTGTSTSRRFYAPCGGVAPNNATSVSGVDTTAGNPNCVGHSLFCAEKGRGGSDARQQGALHKALPFVE